MIGGSFAAQATSSAGADQRTGTLTVDGHEYRFTPSTCLITSEDFVVAGSGVDDDEQFWVAASSTELDLAVGTGSETEKPAEDQLWLLSDEAPSWRAGGTVVTAVAPMSDHRRTGSTSVVGKLEFDCGAARPT